MAPQPIGAPLGPMAAKPMPRFTNGVALFVVIRYTEPSTALWPCCRLVLGAGNVSEPGATLLASSQSMVITVVGEQSGDDLPSKVETASRIPPWLLTLLKVALSAIAIAVVALKVDLSAVWQRLIGQNDWLLLAAAALMTLQIFLGGLRWHVILKALRAPTTASLSIRLYYISVFLNAWMWGAVAGDVVRVWMCYRARMGASTSVGSVVLDRVAGVAAIGVLVLATAPLFVWRVGLVLSAVVPVGIATAGLLAISIAGQFHRLPLDWQRTRLLRGLHSLSTSIRMIFLRPAAAFRVLGLAIVAQITLAITAYIVGLSLHVGLSFFDSLVLMQPVALIAALPISVGGWGVRETAMIGLLGIVEISPSAALSLSVQLGLLAMLVSLPGLVLWLTLKTRLDSTDECH